jgi:2-C-methyl-D-erythritol 4-phosphate cytidylyltransferase/2-C-methyl-D-erythritol 2,4-cyclodiphosphate synthase
VSGARVGAIVAAGGRGDRLGGGIPKQLRPLGATSMLELSVGAVLASSRVDAVVVVLPAPEAAAPPEWLGAAGPRVRVAPGGARRQDSVASGFAALDPALDLVLVHDAARPFLSRDLLERTIDAAATHGAAIAATAVHDTVKQVAWSGTTAFVAATVPREQVFLAQTPQAFRRAVLADAIALGQSGVEATDEAGLAERAGHKVAIVEGDARNRKITTPRDWEEALRIVAPPPPPLIRIGTGYDLHRLVPNRKLLLGGVEIPFELGLAGHSDADIVCHALTDAVLGAAGAGDIGTLFPDTDPRWKDADSVEMLRAAVARVHAAGFVVLNVDVVVVAERPRLGPYRAAVAERLAPVLGVAPSAVGVKGKTNEGVGEIGRREAMAAHAVALLAAAPR